MCICSLSGNSHSNLQEAPSACFYPCQKNPASCPILSCMVFLWSSRWNSPCPLCNQGHRFHPQKPRLYIRIHTHRAPLWSWFRNTLSCALRHYSSRQWFQAPRLYPGKVGESSFRKKEGNEGEWLSGMFHPCLHHILH